MKIAPVSGFRPQRRYQTRPLAFPALHQLVCTTSLQHSLILPSHSSTSGAHLKLLEHALRGAHTRHTCHICTQRPSYEYDDPPFATHYHAKRPASGGRRARQPRHTCLGDMNRRPSQKEPCNARFSQTCTSGAVGTATTGQFLRWGEEGLWRGFRAPPRAR